jgi:hypothetical protein
LLGLTILTRRFLVVQGEDDSRALRLPKNTAFGRVLPKNKIMSTEAQVAPSAGVCPTGGADRLAVQLAPEPLTWWLTVCSGNSNFQYCLEGWLLKTKCCNALT